MRMSKITAVVSVALVLSAMFAGCGNKAEMPVSEPSASQTVSQNVATEKADASAPAQTIPQNDTTDEADSLTSAQAETPTDTAQPTAASTTPVTQAQKTVTVYKSEGTRKIWAGVVGKIYVAFKEVRSSDGTSSQVYELYVDAGDGYTVWSDGIWELNADKTVLKLTPKNQNENGSIGVAVGKTKTYKADDGVFKVDFTFEQGGKSAIKLSPAKDAV